MKFDVHSLAIEIEQVLNQLFGELIGCGDASLIVQPLRSVPGSRITLRPRNKFAAEIRIICEDSVDMIYMTAGESTSFEIPLEGGRYTQLREADEFIAIVRAIVDGKFREIICTRDSEIVRSKAVLEPENATPIQIKTAQSLLGLLRRCQEHKRVYLPYKQY